MTNISRANNSWASKNILQIENEEIKQCLVTACQLTSWWLYVVSTQVESDCIHARISSIHLRYPATPNNAYMLTGEGSMTQEGLAGLSF